MTGADRSGSGAKSILEEESSSNLHDSLSILANHAAKSRAGEIAVKVQKVGMVKHVLCPMQGSQYFDPPH